MKTVPILVWLVISASVVGFWIYVWRSLSAIRRKITGDVDGDLERQLCKHSQRVIIGGLISFFTILVILYLVFPSVQWKYKIALAIVAGPLPGLFIVIAISSRNKK